MYIDGVMTGLIIVATPIGNRDDITTRAIQLLGDVDFIIAEDTRHTGELLAYYGIKKPLISFRDAPRVVMERTLKIIADRLTSGQVAAYVTDAGTPNISDPGWRLIKLALDLDLPVSPVPGPSAVTALVSVAHIPLDEYRFIGFLPKKKGHQTKIEDILHYFNAKESRGVIFYESPNRIQKTLTNFADTKVKLSVVIGRELTKKFETIYRGALTKNFIKQLPSKGEYVILIYSPVA